MAGLGTLGRLRTGRVLLALFLASCTLVRSLDGLSDRYGAFADAGPDATADVANVPDAGPVCDPASNFGAPMLLRSISTPSDEGSARLSEDERTVFFDAQRNASGGAPAENDSWDIFTATRSDDGDTFGPVARVEGPNTTGSQEFSPALTSDERKLFFERKSGPNSDIMFVARDKRGGPWGAAQIAPGIATTLYEANPFVRTDDSQVWFVANGHDAGTDIFLARLTPGGYAPDSVPELNTEDQEFTPVISNDGLTIYFSSDRPLSRSLGLNVWVASRRSTSVPFSRAAPVDTVNSDADDNPTWISADGCRLYMSSTRDGLGGQDIYLAKRSPALR